MICRLHACGSAAVTPNHQCAGSGVLPCRTAEEEGRKVLTVEGFTSKIVRTVMWTDVVVAGNWCEEDGRLFRETLAALCLIPITVAAAAVPFRSAALLATVAKVGVRELPAQANEQALSR